MAFTKSVTTPQGYTAGYFDISRVVIDEDRQEAALTIKVYKDATTIGTPGAGQEAVHMIWRRAAFVLYFARAAVTAGSVNAYAAIYQAIADYTAAVQAAEALAAYNVAMKATPPPNPTPAQPAALTANQQTLTAYGNVDVRADANYGGNLFFAGATLS